MSLVAESRVEKQPPSIPKLTRAKEILDHRNVQFNSATRLPAFVRLITEFDGREDQDDQLFRGGLIVLMPGQPNMTPLESWVADQQPKIGKIAREDRNNKLTDAHYLFRDTAKFEESFWITEANRLRRLTVNDPITLEAEIAIRLMYDEAQSGLTDPENLPFVFAYKGQRAVEMIGGIAMHPHLDN